MLDWLKRRHHQGRYRIVASWVESCGRDLLDVGCGRPTPSMPAGGLLSRLGYGQGLDMFPCEIEAPFTLGRMEAMPFPDDTFDVVTALEVIEHVNDVGEAFREVYRVLRPGGVFVMSTPDNHLLFRTLWFTWSRTFGRCWRDTHVSSRTRRAWIRLIEQSAFFELLRVREYWGINTIYMMVSRKGAASGL